MAPAAAPTPQHPAIADPGRLAALLASGLMSAGFDGSLDRWTRLAAGLIHTPMALLSLVDDERQYFKSFIGLPDHVAAQRGTPVERSFCQHVVSLARPFVVTDSRADARVAGNGAIEDLDIVAYAGQPVTTADGHVLGSFCVVDTKPREWTSGELGLLEDLAAGLVAEIDLRAALERADGLQADLTRQARFDALTDLPNRRQLAEDLVEAVARADAPMLAVFDLDGFKSYNDTFGHPAGDALLVRMGEKLRRAIGDEGTAYRLGGDEFCVIAHDELAIDAAAAALCEHGASFAITNSHGRVRLDREAATPERAMQLADERLYRQKNCRSDIARRQAHDVLLGVLHEREPDLSVHVHHVAELARNMGERVGLDANSLNELGRAAQMHDIGKVAIPDGVLSKPGPLDEPEWALMRCHTLLGERILLAAPALAGEASIVRASHERWDGLGYPDGLSGTEIPLGARIVFICDAFHAMTCDRPYRGARSVAEALAELKAEAGRQFDPDLVAVMVSQLEGASREPRAGLSGTRQGGR